MQFTASSQSNPSGRNDSLEWRAAKGFFLLISIYFLLQTILRVCLSSSAHLDESEQLMLTQTLDWGYGPQPPLYTWIQFGFFRVFGLSIFALALFKNLLLFSTYALTYWAARTMTGNRLCGIAAALSLLFIPQVAWESQRDLTHSVLAATFTLATLLSFCRLRERPGIGGYLAFGLCIGLSLLSKYNCLIFVAALVLAAISLPEFRPTIMNPRMLLAVAAALLVFAPHGFWILHHHDLALRSVSKLHLETGNRFAGAAAGLLNMVESIAYFLGPPAVFYALIFAGSSSSAASLQLRAPYARLLLRMLLVISVLIATGVLAFGVTNIRGRWFQPILIYAPVLAVVLFQDRIDSFRLRRFRFTAMAIMLLASVAIAGRIALAEPLHRTEPLNRPYDVLALQMRDALGNATIVVADANLLGGNLRMNLPGKFYLSPETADDISGLPHCAFVWQADKDASPPPRLIAIAEKMGRGDLTNAPAQYFEATFKYHHERKMRVGVITAR